MTYHNATKYILNAPDELPEPTPGARLRILWNHIGNPQKNIKYLRLTGSNGKTVCAELLTSVFRQSSYTVGCLNLSIQADIRSSIRINGTPISFEEMADITDQIYRIQQSCNKKEAIKAISQNEAEETPDETPQADFILTKYEILLTAALLAFQAHGCIFSLLESDLGNADPTRFLPSPFAAAICGTIPSDDRKEIQAIRSYLNHGIQEIVSAPQNQEAYQVISQTCAVINCRLTIPTKAQMNIQKISLSGSEFFYKNHSYRLNLCGKFQITNATVVLEILEMLNRRGYSFARQTIVDGLRQTKIPTKFEILSVSPTIIADSTHADIAVETVCASMAEFRHIIGSKVRLILPEGDIVDRYVCVLQNMDYTISSIVTFPNTLVSDTELRKKVRRTVKQFLQELPDDEILLLSGPTNFTSVIREEILAILGFSFTNH